MTAVMIVAAPWLALMVLILWDIRKSGEYISFDPMVVLTAVLAVFTGIACYIAYLQWTTAKQADDTYWAGQRPWIGVKSKLVITTFNTVNSNEYIHVITAANLANYGNIPAVDTIILTLTFAEMSDGDPGSTYSLAESDKALQWRNLMKEKLCQSIDGIDKPYFDIAKGYVVKSAPSIFPKEVSSIDISNIVPIGNDHIRVVDIWSANCIRYRFGDSDGRKGSLFFISQITPIAGGQFLLSADNTLPNPEVSLLDSETRAR